MSFFSEFSGKSFSRISLSSVYTDLGSYSGFAASAIPGHASTRDDMLYSERRKIVSNYFIDYIINKKFKNSYLMFSFNYFDIKRQFNDFNRFDSTFEESGKLFLLNTRYRKNIKRGILEFFGVLNVLERTNQNSELGRYPQETLDSGRFSFITGFIFKKRGLNVRSSFILETEDLNPYSTNFSKELMDNDGEGFYPINRLGEFSSGTFNLNIRIPFKIKLPDTKIGVDTFVDLRASSINGTEDIFDFSTVTFNSDPYLVTLWNRGEDYKNSNINLNGGINLSVDLSEKISLKGKFFLKYSRLNFDFSDNNLSFVTPGFDAGVLLFKNKNPEIFVAYGIMPDDIGEDVNFFLEQGRPSGTVYRWNDANEDRIFQQGERGSVFGYTGNRYHFIEKNLSVPVKNRLLLSISSKVSKRFVLNIKGTYKRIKNNFWINYNRDYGFFEKHNDYDIFFYDKPFRDYYLSNYDFDKDPFYAQLLINLRGGREKRWFYSFSFLAHIGMGYTSFGNGPGANDIGIIDESQANPNLWINGFGRLDGDRGFVGKMFFGFYLFRNFFAGISLKYRDGTPFAFINTIYEYDQRVFYYKTIKAENEKGVKGGPREDFISDISLRFNYSFRLFNKDAILSFSFFNIFDFGNELSEYVFSGGTRDAMELQIPRSFRLTLSWEF